MAHAMSSWAWARWAEICTQEMHSKHHHMRQPPNQVPSVVHKQPNNRIAFFT